MKTYLDKIISIYKSEQFQKIWKDPVWSKVISVGIIALISAILTAFYSLWNWLRLSNFLTSFFDFFKSIFYQLVQWLDTRIPDDNINLFVKMFLVLASTYIISIFIYRKTEPFWRNLLRSKTPETEAVPYLIRHPIHIFGDRIASAFPGVSGLVWFNNSREAAHRLEVFLRKPLRYRREDEDGMEFFTDVFWWFREELICLLVIFVL